MEIELMNIPQLKKMSRQFTESDPMTLGSCCTPKNNAASCCTPSQTKEENDGACCPQPEDGSQCCNK